MSDRFKNERTEINIWKTGDKTVSTIHRREADGTETSAVLNIAEPMELSLQDEQPVDRGHEMVLRR